MWQDFDPVVLKAFLKGSFRFRDRTRPRFLHPIIKKTPVDEAQFDFETEHDYWTFSI
jgi:hypothetical protein